MCRPNAHTHTGIRLISSYINSLRNQTITLIRFKFSVIPQCLQHHTLKLIFGRNSIIHDSTRRKFNQGNSCVVSRGSSCNDIRIRNNHHTVGWKFVFCLWRCDIYKTTRLKPSNTPFKRAVQISPLHIFQICIYLNGISGICIKTKAISVRLRTRLTRNKGDPIV